MRNKIAPRINNKTSKPIKFEIKTKIHLSFFYIIPIIPVKKEIIAHAPAKRIGIDKIRLLKIV